MIAAGDVKKGATLRLDGNLYRVTNATYNKPGRGTATMRLNLMDIRTGNTTMRVFSSEDRLDDVFVETHQVRFLYRDGDTLHFMDNETYDQYEVNTTLLGDDLLYLREELEMELRTYEGAAIDYQLPTTVVYRIEEAENAVAGDSTVMCRRRQR